MTNTEAGQDHRIHNLLFGVRRSIRYHNRRRMFFDRWATFTSAISVIFGSATVLALLKGQGGELYAALAATTVTLFSAVDLVVGTSKTARLHADLSRRFIGLEKEIIATPSPTEDDMIRLAGSRLDIEADEPPVLRVLDSLCHNEMLRAMGYDKEQFLRIRWYQRIAPNLIDIREHAIS